MDYLGFNQKQLSKTIEKLNLLLSGYQVYYQNLRNFHWNVKGENFFDLHAQFEALYTDARVKIDDIAERILTLNHRPISTLSEYLHTSTVEEAKHLMDDHDMVLTILENHKELIECMRAVISAAEQAKDEGTIDLIGGFLSELEKKSWMLDAWAAQQTEYSVV